MSPLPRAVNPKINSLLLYHWILEEKKTFTTTTAMTIIIRYNSPSLAKTLLLKSNNNYNKQILSTAIRGVGCYAFVYGGMASPSTGDYKIGMHIISNIIWVTDMSSLP